MFKNVYCRISGDADGKEPACNSGDLGSPCVGKISWKNKWQPAPVSLPGKFHGQRSLVGQGPWGLKESGVAE